MLVLGLPLLGSLMLALFGARRFAAELNVGVSLATLAAGALLVVRVIKHGPILALREQFFVDSFNVFLVGRHGSRHTLDGVAGLFVPYACQPGSGLEVFHSLWGRHCPSVVRDDLIVFRRGAALRAERHDRPFVDPSQRSQRAA